MFDDVSRDTGPSVSAVLIPHTHSSSSVYSCWPAGNQSYRVLVVVVVVMVSLSSGPLICRSKTCLLLPDVVEGRPIVVYVCSALWDHILTPTCLIITEMSAIECQSLKQ
ncbi:hypothetical protein Vretimale_7285 [Volvox reticuliferus]|uniref:Uncharacterized protein n=1 Tax=Volvox reticuliferus TaxID=1737510 RepID=A0A8J4FSA7_9CHLO|nr:hypothetical protein Vretifemale_11184 [Volvox reticuliferus]GIM02411.1 hypothetical protein Vretimale_7285 [Volvox reticuliferus]